MLSLLMGGETELRPTVPAPAGRSRVGAGEGYPAKTLSRQISAATAGKTQLFSLSVIRGAKLHTILLRSIDTI